MHFNLICRWGYKIINKKFNFIEDGKYDTAPIYNTPDIEKVNIEHQKSSRV